MSWLRENFSFLVLLWARGFSKTFYRPRVRWVGDPVDDPWTDLRLVVLLNHTSLYEWLFVSVPPTSFLRRLASRGVLPAADKTLRRPMVGLFFKLLSRHVIAISREPDHTWQAVLRRIDPDSMVIIAPEGRMKRADGLDKHGQPMTVRGGIADVLTAIGSGRMLLVYSGGLHHIQVPGQVLPRLFQPLPLALEVVEIADYLEGVGLHRSHAEIKRVIKADLERRRDLHCETLAVSL